MENNRNTFTPKPNDFAMPKWLLMNEDLSTGAKMVYMVLTICAGQKDYAFPSQEYLSQAASVCVRTVQRHLKTLADFGLIRIDKRYVHGTSRTVYYFLNHAIMSFEKKSKDTIAKKPDTKTITSGCNLENLSPEDDKKSQTRHDNFSAPSYKEEGYLNLNNSPLPPAPSTSTSGQKIQKAISGGGDYFLEVEKEIDSKKENPIWNQIKTKLIPILTDTDLKTWIEPLDFEFDEARPILRFPNQFFMNWVRNHYAEPLNQAFQELGFNTPQFKLFTDSQIQALEKRQREEALATLSKAGSASGPSNLSTDSDVDALPLEEQYTKIYQAYPRNYECREEGWQVFQRLHKRLGLPKASELIKAVNRAKSNNPSWQREGGRYIPQIQKWLSERRWMD